jgi:hypothetical protein
MGPEVIGAHSVTEAVMHMLIAPCTACGHGARDLSDPALKSQDVIRITATCRNCGATDEGLYRSPTPPGAVDPLSDSSPINRAKEASEIIDVVEWVTLYQMMIEAAGRTPDRQEARWRKHRAGECLEEALKFFEPENDVPPQSAFFTDCSERAFGDHPERFTRQRLVSLRAKLPTMGVQERLEGHKGHPRGRSHWWQIWRRH